MGIDKSKIRRNAERYLTQGRISAAIREYERVVESDPDDVNTLNMIGDLYVKAEDKDAAVKCYQDVAGHYSTKGFEKKAIAVYNKIHRLVPDSPETSKKLAELYQIRGSLAEARDHYEIVATHYEQQGDKVEALTIWEKIAEIAPKNTEIYLKIADFYWQNNQLEEAARAFIEGGTRLAANKDHQEAVAAFLRALEVVPDDLDAVRGYVDSQMSLGYPEDAVRILDDLYENDPYNSEVVFLLVDCYLDMEDPEKAEIITVDLVTQEPKAYTKLLDLVDFYMKGDDLESAVRVLSLISEQLLVSQKPERLRDLLNEIVTRNPEQIQALRLLVRYYSWHKDDYEHRRVLEQLADAAKYNDSDEDERYAITQLLLISPQEDRYIARLKEINRGEESLSDENIEKSDEAESDGSVPSFDAVNGLLNQRDTGGPDSKNGSVTEYTKADFEEPEAEITLTEADLHSLAEEQESSEPKELDINEQIENLKFYIDQGYVDIAEHTLKELDSEHGEKEEFDEIRKILKQISVDAPEEESVYEIDADGSASEFNLDEFSSNGLPDESTVELESEETAEDEQSESLELTEEEPAAEDEGESIDSEQENEIQDDSPVSEEDEFDTVSDDELITEECFESEDDAAEQDDIEPTDQTEDADQADDELNEGADPEERTAAGEPPDSDSDAESLQIGDSADLAEDDLAAKTGDEISSSDPDVPEADESTDEIDSQSELDLTSEPETADEDTEPHSESDEFSQVDDEQVEEESDSNEVRSESGDDVESSDEIETVSKSKPLPEVSESTDDESQDGEVEDESVQSSENSDDDVSADGSEEYDTHYHHAVAYKEMGLLEDAVREFESAIESVDPNDGSGRFLQCCTLIAHSYIEQNSPAEAIIWFEKAFEVDSLDENETNALNYELANAHVVDGDYERALAMFEKIYTSDSDYRDVGERIDECKEKAGLVPA